MVFEIDTHAAVREDLRMAKAKLMELLMQVGVSRRINYSITVENYDFVSPNIKTDLKIGFFW
tara:strand:- start:304 stop:489 length:186 start_codon:yes stop_codon:yes gene_type:complete